MFIKLRARIVHSRQKRPGCPDSGRMEYWNCGLTALFLSGYPLWRIGLHLLDDGFHLLYGQIGGSLLLFLWQFVVAQSLFYIRAIRAAKQLDLLFFEDLDSTLFLGR